MRMTLPGPYALLQRAVRPHTHTYACVSVAVLAVLLRWPCITGDFVYDDSRVLVENPAVQANASFVDLWRVDYWGTPITSEYSHGSYRPLTSLTFWLTTVLARHVDGPTNPWVYHVFSHVMHGVNAVLVVGFIAQLVGLCMAAAGVAAGRRKRSVGADKGAQVHSEEATLQTRLRTWQLPPLSLVGMLGALVFVVHPVNTEAVCNIANRGEVLACTFLLLSVRASLSALAQRMVREMFLVSEKAPKVKLLVVHVLQEARAVLYQMVEEKELHPECLGWFPLHLRSSAAAGTAQSMLFGALAVLCKETGIIAYLFGAVISCFMFLYIASEQLSELPARALGLLRATANVVDADQAAKQSKQVKHAAGTSKTPDKLSLLADAATYVMCGALVFTCRLAIQGWRQPVFNALENPTIGLPVLWRVLTAGYLWLRHFMLLVWPVPLAVDWSFLSIPPIQTLFDARIASMAVVTTAVLLLATWMLYVIHSFKCISRRALRLLRGPDTSAAASPRSPRNDTRALSPRQAPSNSRNVSPAAVATAMLALLSVISAMVALLPACNFIITLGFSIAERVLYPAVAVAVAPLAGLCVASALVVLEERPSFGTITAVKGLRQLPASWGAVFPLLAVAVLAGLARSMAWGNELALWQSAIAVHPHHAKAWYSYGHALLLANRTAEAEAALDTALQLHPRSDDYPQLRQSDTINFDAVVDLVNINLNVKNDTGAALQLIEDTIQAVNYTIACKPWRHAFTAQGPPDDSTRFCSGAEAAYALHPEFRDNHDRMPMIGLIAVNLAVLRAAKNANASGSMSSARDAIHKAVAAMVELPVHKRDPMYALVLANRMNGLAERGLAAAWYEAYSHWLWHWRRRSDAAHVSWSAITRALHRPAPVGATAGAGDCPPEPPAFRIQASAVGSQWNVNAQATTDTANGIVAAPSSAGSFLERVNANARAAKSRSTKCRQTIADSTTTWVWNATDVAKDLDPTTERFTCACASLAECHGSPCAALFAASNAAASSINHLFDVLALRQAAGIVDTWFCAKSTVTADLPVLPKVVVTANNATRPDSTFPELRGAVDSLLRHVYTAIELHASMGNAESQDYLREILSVTDAKLCPRS